MRLWIQDGGLACCANAAPPGRLPFLPRVETNPPAETAKFVHPFLHTHTHRSAPTAIRTPPFSALHDDSLIICAGSCFLSDASGETARAEQGDLDSLLQDFSYLKSLEHKHVAPKRASKKLQLPDQRCVGAACVQPGSGGLCG